MILSLFSFFALQAFAEVTPKEVVTSSLEHYPEVRKAILDLEISEGDLRKARGAFDTKIKGRADTRSTGFYDGEYKEIKISKPLKVLNSEVYAGARQSDGKFPLYEGKAETLNDGELMFGVSLSLLRNNLIDDRRFDLLNQRENKEQASLNLIQTKLNIQTLALNAYWDWFALGHQVLIHKEILELAKTRNNKIMRRIRAGDLARIYGVENEQYIVKRRVEYLKSQTKFKKAAFYLSLFYRDENAKPKELLLEDVPSLANINISSVRPLSVLFDKAQKNSIKLKALRSKEKQAKGNLKLAKNQMMPKLNFAYELSRDHGDGSSELFGSENRFMLNFEMPLEFNKERGKKAAAKAKLNQNKINTSFAIDKLFVDLQKIKIDLTNSFEVYFLTKKQIDLSRKLVKAEQFKFKSGASDLILVNLREQNYAEAQIKNLGSLLNYQSKIADLKKLLVEFI